MVRVIETFATNVTGSLTGDYTKTQSAQDTLARSAILGKRPDSQRIRYVTSWSLEVIRCLVRARRVINGIYLFPNWGESVEQVS